MCTLVQPQLHRPKGITPTPTRGSCRQPQSLLQCPPCRPSPLLSPPQALLCIPRYPRNRRPCRTLVRWHLCRATESQSHWPHLPQQCINSSLPPLLPMLGRQALNQLPRHACPTAMANSQMDMWMCFSLASMGSPPPLAMLVPALSHAVCPLVLMVVPVVSNQWPVQVCMASPSLPATSLLVLRWLLKDHTARTSPQLPTPKLQRTLWSRLQPVLCMGPTERPTLQRSWWAMVHRLLGEVWAWLLPMAVWSHRAVSEGTPRPAHRPTDTRTAISSSRTAAGPRSPTISPPRGSRIPGAAAGLGPRSTMTHVHAHGPCMSTHTQMSMSSHTRTPTGGASIPLQGIVTAN
mmetsp:Transcript_64750/g.115143  ORF Transcript_64750/g.115143 Transcript_64750/m.115143 type:complete len:348 (+) Transcript_64750:488-1531(+)